MNALPSFPKIRPIVSHCSNPKRTTESAVTLPEGAFEGSGTGVDCELENDVASCVIEEPVLVVSVLSSAPAPDVAVTTIVVSGEGCAVTIEVTVVVLELCCESVVYEVVAKLFDCGKAKDHVEVNARAVRRTPRNRIASNDVGNAWSRS